MRSQLEILPKRFKAISLSEEEIVLPYEEALEAIDIIESKGIAILGWEGWVKSCDGAVGHGVAPQGLEGNLSVGVSESAEMCRKTIIEENAKWAVSNPGTTDVLHYCITVAV